LLNRKISCHIIVMIIVLMCMVPVSFSQNTYTKIEGEWFQNGQQGKKMTSAALGMQEGFFSGNGAAVIDGSTADMPSGGYVLIYELYMPYSGIYSMNFFSTLNTSGQQVSPFSLDVNADTEFTVSAIQGEANGIYGLYNAKIGLNSGLNIITFHVREPKMGSENCLFCLDYIDLTFIQEYCDSYKLESDDFYTNNSGAAKMAQEANTGLSGGTAYQFANPADRPIAVEYGVFVQDDGYYSVQTICSDLGQTYTSDFDMIINDQTYSFNVNNTTKLTDITGTYDPGLYKKYELNSAVYLQKGYNKVKLYSNEIRTNNIYLYCLDYIAFNKLSDKIVIEGESGANGLFTQTDNTSASGGKILKLDTESTNLPLQYSLSCNAKVAGTYDVLIDMGANVMEDENTQSFADAIISFDGLNFVRLTCGTPQNNWSDANMEKVQELSSAGIDGLARYKLKTSMTLSLGQKNIYFMLIANENSRAVFYLDKIEFSPVPFQLKDVSVSPEKSALVTGETTNIKISPVGEQGTPIQLDELRANGMVTFCSNDSTVANVNSLGVIKAKQPGMSKIQVCLYDGSVTKQYEFDIAVYNQNENIIILNSNFDNDGVTAKVAVPNGETLADPMQMVFTNNGAGKMNNITVSNINAVPSMFVQDIKANFSVNTGDIINIFLWHGLDTLQPALRKIIMCK